MKLGKTAARQLELVDLFGYAPYNFATFQDSSAYGLSDT